MKKLFLLLTAITLTISVNAQELTYRNIFSGVQQNGVRQQHWQVQNMMSGDALGFYQSGRALVRSGLYSLSLGIGFAAIELAIRNEVGFTTISGGVLAVAGTIGVFIGQNRIRHAVQLHNTGTNNPVVYQMDFGLTESGGLGLTLRF